MTSLIIPFLFLEPSRILGLHYTRSLASNLHLLSTAEQLQSITHAVVGIVRKREKKFIKNYGERHELVSHSWVSK
jgi:hypothetical protein